MTRAAGHVLAFAAPLTAVWLYALANSTLGAATYAIPVGLSAAGLAAYGLHRAVLRDRWALLALLAFAAFVLNISFRTREYGEAGIDWQNGLKIATWLVLLGISVANLRRIAGFVADPVIGPLFCFGVVALLSAAYSPVPAYSAACAVGTLAYLSFACLVAREVGARPLVLTLVWTLAAYLGATWAFAAVSPDAAFAAPHGDEAGHRLQGFSGHANILAKQAVVVVCLALAALHRGYLGRFAGWALVALGAATVLATGSRTAAVALALACVLVALKAKRLLLPAALALVPLLGLLALAASSSTLLDLNALLGSFSRTGDASEVLTLTGRTELWGAAWQKILERPLLGHGFASFEMIMTREWFGAADAAVGAHNTWLQCLFTLGLVGTLPVFGAFAVLLWRWKARPDAMRDVFALFLLVAGMAETEIVAIPALLNLVFYGVLALDAAPSPTPVPGSLCLR